MILFFKHDFMNDLLYELKCYLLAFLILILWLVHASITLYLHTCSIRLKQFDAVTVRVTSVVTVARQIMIFLIK